MSEARKPTLADVVSGAVAAGLADVRITIPARVLSYDRTKQSVTVQPLIREIVTDENGDDQVEALPAIQNVPVAFYRGGGFHLVFPLAVGDTGELAFTDVSLDKWLSEGGEVDPRIGRSHGVNDCVFRPGLRAFKNAIALPAGDFIALGDETSATYEKAVLGETLRAYLVSLKSHIDGLLVGGSGSAANPTTPDVPSVGDLLSSSVRLTP